MSVEIPFRRSNPSKVTPAFKPIWMEASKTELAQSALLQIKMTYQSGREKVEKKSFHLGGNWLGDIFLGSLSGRVHAFLLPLSTHPQTNVQRLKALCAIARASEERQWPAGSLEYIEHTLDLDRFSGGDHWIGRVMFS